MTLHSMTAFAGTAGSHGRHAWTLDLKSVNARGLDLKLRLPSSLDPHEAAIRKTAGARLTRGTVSITLRLDAGSIEMAYAVNADLLTTLAKTLIEASNRTGLAAPTLDALVRVPGVLEQADSDMAEEGLNEALLASLNGGIDALAEARGEEGAQLAVLLTDHIDTLTRLTDDAEATGASRPAARQERLRAMVADLDVALPSERLVQEIALLAVKIDIREELDRLRTHIAAIRDLLAKGGPIGRRLDFFAQELNREANTLCSKAGDAALTAIGVEMKVVIDQFREQVMNVE